MELTIDTSTKFASVGISDQGDIRREYSWFSNQNHTIELLPAVEYILEASSVTPSDLDAVFVAKGPGGFSALRIGMSIAKGLHVSHGLPVIGISTLDIEAYPFIDSGLVVCPLIDIGRGEKALALYRKKDEHFEKLCEEKVVHTDNLMTIIDTPTIFCGEGAVNLEISSGSMTDTNFVYWRQYCPTRRPGTLSVLGYRQLLLGGPKHVSTLEPTYMRRPSITAPKN